MRLFGPFCRDFFVPWSDLVVVRKTSLLQPVAKLQFGNPIVGALTISAHVGDKLASAAPGHWPEAGPPRIEKRSETFGRLFMQWAGLTCFAALFFIVVPMLRGWDAQFPVLVAVLFPAVFYGVVFGVRYSRERRRWRARHPTQISSSRPSRGSKRQSTASAPAPRAWSCPRPLARPRTPRHPASRRSSAGTG